MRLDILLVEKKLAASRGRAQALIKEGKVKVEGLGKLKPSIDVPEDAGIHLLEPDDGYVSRGALKLKPIIDATGFNFKHKTCLDVGASTGGFTQVALEEGAKHVYAVDVGTGQLSDVFKGDPRVTSFEKTDGRNLSKAQIKNAPDVMLCDVSFISCTRILAHVLLTFPSIKDAFVLVKPQFELTREDVGPGGIVRNKNRQFDALEKVKACLNELGFETPTFVKIRQAKKNSNQEFMVHGQKPLPEKA